MACARAGGVEASWARDWRCRNRSRCPFQYDSRMLSPDRLATLACKVSNASTTSGAVSKSPCLRKHRFNSSRASSTWATSGLQDSFLTMFATRTWPTQGTQWNCPLIEGNLPFAKLGRKAYQFCVARTTDSAAGHTVTCSGLNQLQHLLFSTLYYYSKHPL